MSSMMWEHKFLYQKKLCKVFSSVFFCLPKHISKRVPCVLRFYHRFLLLFGFLSQLHLVEQRFFYIYVYNTFSKCKNTSQGLRIKNSHGFRFAFILFSVKVSIVCTFHYCCFAYINTNSVKQKKNIFTSFVSSAKVCLHTIVTRKEKNTTLQLTKMHKICGSEQIFRLAAK